MKNKLTLLLLTIITLSLTECKKDYKKYPSDIPEWLKTRIDKMGKQGGCLSSSGTTLTITEIKCNANDSLLYVFSGYSNPGETYYYDNSGNIICDDCPGNGTGVECGNYISNNYHNSRQIWAQNRKYCKY